MNNTDKYKRISKFLSLILRHKPERINLSLDPYGWAEVDELILKMNQHQKKINFPTLEAIVATNQKQRFSFNQNQTKIRANQGHSIDIDLGYDPIEPPEILYHGTATKHLDSIMEIGLIKGNRHHVHLSKDVITAHNVGSRHGTPIILEVFAEKMHKVGYTFYRSKNGVWLSDQVPPQYLRKQV